MKITIKVQRDEILEEQYLPVYRLIKKNKWRWEAVGACLALGGGFLSPVIAIILNLLVSYTRSDYERAVLSRVSTVLFILTVPLLLLGAHFLDLLDQRALELAVSEADALEQTIGHLGLTAKAEDF